MKRRLAQLRPRQWIKNVLVFVAPFGAGVTELDNVARLALGFVSFSIVASALYVVNDIADLEADRAHPEKRNRPLASGDQTIAEAIGTVVVLIAVGFALAALLRPVFVVVLSFYALNTLLYTYWGKQVPILDMLQVAAGFLARMVAGVVIIDVDASPWFLSVALFGSLLMIAGKRLAEKRGQADVAKTRPSLEGVSEEFINQVVVVAAAGLVLTYAQWSFGGVEATRAVDESWALAAIGPFLFCVLRYLLLIDRSETEKPEVAIFDWYLIVGAVMWSVLIGGGVYLQ